MDPNALALRTLELVDVRSESRDEAELAELVAAIVPLELRHRRDSTLLYTTGRGGRPLVVLAGHLDTVPENGNLPGRIADGAVHGLGASDMKGGLAVMIELARLIAAERPALGVDLDFLFFPREELPVEQSALPEVLDAGLLDGAGLVIVLEPTDNTIQAGCLGNLDAELRFEGVSSHSARPWQGVNAIERAVEGLRGLVGLEPNDVVVEGLLFREVLSATIISGGRASNVVPDDVRCTLNFRYAPSRSADEGWQRLRELVGPELEPRLLSNSPPARVVGDTPLLRRLRAAGDFALEPKQAWTPVAEFSGRGLDAVNLGPGATRYAHKRDEQIEIGALERCFESLRRFALA